MAQMVCMWLDDVRPAPNGWTHCRTAEEAAALLSSGLVESASLDHDLGHCPLCETVEDTDEGPRIVDSAACQHLRTGYDLVKWMVEFGHWPSQKPRVHSANPVGAANMRATIERYWNDRVAPCREDE